jgi:ATP-dependent Clp protease adaptor protein ClpS
MSSDKPLWLPNTEGDAAVAEKTKAPKKYKVILLNDDFTPMDFVVGVLKKFFAKPQEEAEAIMWKVHKEGRGIAGVFTKEVAEMKSMQTNQYARAHQYPLKSIIEPE